MTPAAGGMMSTVSKQEKGNGGNCRFQARIERRDLGSGCYPRQVGSAVRFGVTGVKLRWDPRRSGDRFRR